MQPKPPRANHSGAEACTAVVSSTMATGISYTLNGHYLQPARFALRSGSTRTLGWLDAGRQHPASSSLAPGLQTVSESDRVPGALLPAAQIGKQGRHTLPLVRRSRQIARFEWICGEIVEFVPAE